MTKAMIYSRMVSLAGSILTLVQIFLLAGNRNGICFNDGCEIVDSLTSVPPIVLNIGGFLFFQAVFWGLWWAKDNRLRLQYLNILLLAGLAAEGVLVSFQQVIAQVFCTYCLVVLVLVVVLNVLAGFRQVFAGASVLLAVIIGFSSLQFSAPKTDMIKNIDSGTFATLSSTKSNPKRYLFFSSTCRHCENVIESLNEKNSCTINFNPIDEITTFSLNSAKKTQKYSTEVNREFLSSLGIDEVPILLTIGPDGLQIIKRENNIQKYLQQSCGVNLETSPVSAFGGASPVAGQSEYVPPGLDDSCSVNSDCEDPGLFPQTN